MDGNGLRREQCGEHAGRVSQGQGRCRSLKWVCKQQRHIGTLNPVIGSRAIGPARGRNEPAPPDTSRTCGTPRDIGPLMACRKRAPTADSVEGAFGRRTLTIQRKTCRRWMVCPMPWLDRPRLRALKLMQCPQRRYAESSVDEGTRAVVACFVCRCRTARPQSVGVG